MQIVFFRVILKFKKLQSQQTKIFFLATKERNFCNWIHYEITNK